MVLQHRNGEPPAPATATAPQRKRGTPHNAIDEARILDAVRPMLLALGPNRMTMADVARQVQVSRATLYRHWPNVRTLVGAVAAREWTQLALAVTPRRANTGRATLVLRLVTVVGAARNNPVLVTILRDDPEIMLPFLLEQRGRTVIAMLGLVSQWLVDGQRDGSIRRADVRVTAKAVQLAALSFILSAAALADSPDELTRLDRELATMLDRYLDPGPRR